jgi:hypothetical protein
MARGGPATSRGRASTRVEKEPRSAARRCWPRRRPGRRGGSVSGTVDDRDGGAAVGVGGARLVTVDRVDAVFVGAAGGLPVSGADDAPASGAGDTPVDRAGNATVGGAERIVIVAHGRAVGG